MELHISECFLLLLCFLTYNDSLVSYEKKLKKIQGRLLAFVKPKLHISIDEGVT